MPAIVSADDKPRRARRKAESRRWVREVKGIAALVLAGFGVVALATFDPERVPAVQEGLAGPVGLWLAWALFHAFGYASVLLPVLLGAWGVSSFLRPVRGPRRAAPPRPRRAAGHGHRPPGAGDTRRGREPRRPRGLGARVRAARRAGVGGGLARAAGRAARGHAARHAGVLRGGGSSAGRPSGAGAPAAGGRAGGAAGHPGGDSRGAGAARARNAGARASARGRRALRAPAAGSWSGDSPGRRPSISARAVREAFPAAPVGLLKVPPPSELRRTREELQDNAETLRRKLQDFEVEGRIVQVVRSPSSHPTSSSRRPASRSARWSTAAMISPWR